MNKLYLAYGSNLNIEQMHRRCPTARIVGYTYLPDTRLIFRGSSSGFYQGYRDFGFNIADLQEAMYNTMEELK